MRVLKYAIVSAICCTIGWIKDVQGIEKKCGVAGKFTTDTRIVNGQSVGYVKYPWYASLMLASRPKQLMCGGSLIGPRHVITAAHCFKPWFEAVEQMKITFEDIYLVNIGVINICASDKPRVNYKAKKVYIHEKYFTNNPYYDIALIVLEQEVMETTPICLPQLRYESENRTGLDGIIIGLGKQASNAWRLPCQLQEATVPVQSDTVCKQMMQKMQGNSSTFIGAFCAGYLEGGIDTCQGDSGGPLQVKTTDDAGVETYMLLGVTSFGFGCAQPNLLGVYTDVSHYLNWIHERMTQGNEEIVIQPISFPNPDLGKDVHPIGNPRPKPVHKRRQQSPSLLHILTRW